MNAYISYHRHLYQSVRSLFDLKYIFSLAVTIVAQNLLFCHLTSLSLFYFIPIPLLPLIFPYLLSLSILPLILFYPILSHSYPRLLPYPSSYSDLSYSILPLILSYPSSLLSLLFYPILLYFRFYLNTWKRQMQTL